MKVGAFLLMVVSLVRRVTQEVFFDYKLFFTFSSVAVWVLCGLAQLSPFHVLWPLLEAPFLSSAGQIFFLVLVHFSKQVFDFPRQCWFNRDSTLVLLNGLLSLCSDFSYMRDRWYCPWFIDDKPEALRGGLTWKWQN